MLFLKGFDDDDDDDDDVLLLFFLSALMSSSPKSSESTMELLFSPDKTSSKSSSSTNRKRRKALLRSIEKMFHTSISCLVAMLCFYGIYRAIDDTHPETLAKMPKFGHHHLHHRDDESSFSSARRSASRSSGKSNRLVDSLANDLSRAKTALTDAKIHERAIEEELMETRARERSIYQEAETLKSKLIGASRDQVEDVVEDVD